MHDNYPRRGRKGTVTVVSSINSINDIDKNKQYRQSFTT